LSALGAALTATIATSTLAAVDPPASTATTGAVAAVVSAVEGLLSPRISLEYRVRHHGGLAVALRRPAPELATSTSDCGPGSIWA
jgi:hypothetical protein